MSRHKGLTPEQRIEAVMALLRREESAAKLARRFGVSEQTLYRYREQFLEGGKTALADGRGKDPREREIDTLKKDVAHRDRVIGELTIANRILKKVEEGLL